MLRLLLVVEPLPEQHPAVASALADVQVTEVYAAEAVSVGALVAEGHGLVVRVEPRLADGGDAVTLVREFAGRLDLPDADVDGERMVFAFAPESVVRQVVMYALEAPIPPDRLRIEPGTLAEVEVRLDAPWTVNRLNDGCHLGDGRI